MISYETFCKIRDYHQHQGLTVAQICRELGLDPKTVGKWIQANNYRPRASSPRSSKLDPFKPRVVRLLESHPYNVGNTRRKLSFFVMVLCYSRLMYLEFTVSQTLEHFLNCHQNAFQSFGGVVKKVMVDNLKTAVLRRLIGEAPVFNPHYLDFSRHCGFTIVACNVGKGNEKGRVENGVGYVKKNFLNGLDIPDFSAVNPAAKHWLESIANVRKHGETHDRPIDRLQTEKSALLPLPPSSYDVGAIHLVRASNRFRVTLDTNRYSVPSEYASTRLTLKAYPDHLVAYHQDKLIARHVRCYDRHQDFENPDHPRELLAQRRKACDQTLLRRFLALSPSAERYYQELQQRRLNPRQDRAIQRRLKLARFPFLKTLDQFNGRPGRKKSIDCRSRTCFA